MTSRRRDLPAGFPLVAAVMNCAPRIRATLVQAVHSREGARKRKRGNTMNRKYALLTAAVGGLAVGCSNLAADQGGVGGGDAPGGGGGDQTGGVEFLTTAPTGAQCIRIVATPATGAAITKTF